MATPLNLYDNKDFFRLYIAGVYKYVDEPYGWDKVRIKSERDKDTRGLNYEFVDPKVTVTFPTREGMEEINDVYDTIGIDGEIIFQYGYEEDGEKKPQFTGRINLSDRIRNDDGLQVTIEKTVFSAKLRTRYETKVAMNAVVDLDNAVVVPPAPVDIRLHSKRLKQISRGGTVTGFPLTTTVIPALFTPIWYIQGDTSNELISELQEMFELPLAITSGLTHNPLTEDRYQFKATFEGMATMRFHAHYRMKTQPNIFFPGINPLISGSYTAKPVIWVVRAGVIIHTIENPTQNISSANNPFPINTFTHDFDISGSYPLLPDDKVFWEIIFTYGGSQKLDMTEYEGYCEVEQITGEEVSTCKAWRLWDVIKFVTQCATGRADAVESAFWGPGGCGYNYFLTNGFQLRKFDVDARPLQESIKGVWEALEAIWCLGVQYSYNPAGDDIIKMGLAYNLFGAKRIYNFTELYDLADLHAKDAIYNEAEIGYTKILEDELNTLDEYNTFHNYLLPLTSYKQKYSRKCAWIASGYIIEMTRRLQFAENPTDSSSYDDDTFIIAVNDNPIFYNISYNVSATLGYVAFNRELGLAIGSKFIITGGTGVNDGIEYTVTNTIWVAGGLYNPVFVTAPAAVFDNGIGQVQVLTDGIDAERNENFDSVTGVISPETSYNLRLSPKRMFYNHSRFITPGLELKPGATAVIKNTGVKQNGELTTKFSDQATCKLTEQNYTLQEKGDIVLDDFNGNLAVWQPRDAKFKAPMTYRDLLELRKRLIGQTGTDEDYGLVTWGDYDGKYWEGYVMEFEYDPYAEEIEVVVRKVRQIL